MTELYNQDYGAFVGLGSGYRGYQNRLMLAAFSRAVRAREHDCILEIGCNRGELVLELARQAQEVLGIDINEQILRGLRLDQRFHLMSATNLRFENERFDKVCAFEVLEHIEDVGQVFREVHRVLKHEGEFTISFPLEVVRGQAALIDSLTVYGDLRHARLLHVHRLTPTKIRWLCKGLSMEVTSSTLRFLPGPFYVMTLKKTG